MSIKSPKLTLPQLPNIVIQRVKSRTYDWSPRRLWSKVRRGWQKLEREGTCSASMNLLIQIVFWLETGFIKVHTAPPCTQNGPDRRDLCLFDVKKGKRRVWVKNYRIPIPLGRDVFRVPVAVCSYCEHSDGVNFRAGRHFQGSQGTFNYLISTHLFRMNFLKSVDGETTETLHGRNFWP